MLKELEGREGRNLSTSISHAAVGDEIWVIGVGARGEKVHVGVDWEQAARTVHPGVEEKILGESERSGGSDFFEYWVIKEACFKANPNNAGTVVSEYLICKLRQNVDGEVVHSGGARLQFRVLAVHEMELAFSFFVASD